MYKKLENILGRTLSSYEFEKLEKLRSIYSEEQIIQTYLNSSSKNINYITKVLQNKKIPSWLYEDVKNEPIDNKSKELFEDFNNFLEEFRK